MTRCTDQFACSEGDCIVYKVIADQGGGKGSAAFAEDAGEAESGEHLQGVSQIDLSAARIAFDQGSAGVLPSIAGVLRCLVGMAQPDGGGFGGLAKAALRGMAQAGVNDDADGLVSGPKVADREVWIVGASGASADQHSIMVQAQGMNGSACLWAGDPAGFPGAGGDAAI